MKARASVCVARQVSVTVNNVAVSVKRRHAPPGGEESRLPLLRGVRARLKII